MRRFRAAERLQDGRSITIRQWSRRNLRLVDGVGERNTFVGGKIWRGSEVGRGWVAGIFEEVLNGTALDAAFGAYGPSG